MLVVMVVNTFMDVMITATNFTVMHTVIAVNTFIFVMITRLSIGIHMLAVLNCILVLIIALVSLS